MLMNISGKGEQEQKKHIMERRAFKHALGRKPNILTADDQIFYERGLSIQSSSTLDEVCTNDEL